MEYRFLAQQRLDAVLGLLLIALTGALVVFFVSLSLFTHSKEKNRRWRKSTHVAAAFLAG